MASLTPAPVPRASLLEARASSPGGPVVVRAYTRIRNGRPETVRAHERRDPPGGDTRARVGAWLSGARFTQRAEGPSFVIQAMARRPDPSDPRGKPPVLEGGPGGGGAARGGRRPQTPPSQARPSASPAEAEKIRSDLITILAPGGAPIGTARRRTEPNIRGLPGGDQAARRLFKELTQGRGGVDVAMPRYPGRMVQLPDGSRIGYRPASSTGTPAVDVKIPGFREISRIHFN